ncbi:MAG: twin-arginine translocase TatA/TatE family subunit [bacterium]|nr:twin-arginine translocase TatA/TatE family subunit [bacterium]MDD6026163.1 twin-arginine translocase TatA/TatE family subunit [bacterium]
MNNLLLILGFIGTQEVIIIAIIILLLFGGKKIPELMRGIGKGVRSFKEGMDDVKNEMEKPIDQEKNGSENK